MIDLLDKAPIIANCKIIEPFAGDCDLINLFRDELSQLNVMIYDYFC